MFEQRRNEYNQLKVFNHPDRVQNLLSGEFEKVVPVSVELDVTNVCPHACFYCYEFITHEIGLNWELHRPGQTTHFEHASHLLAEMAKCGVKAIEYCGRGEPYAYRRFVELLHVTKDVGLESGIISSGSLMDEGTAEGTLAAAPRWIRFSFDSLDQDTFNAIRRPRTDAVGCAAVLSKIRNFCERAEQERSATRISASTVVLPANYREASALARFSKDLGMRAHVFRLVNYKDRDRFYDGIWDDVRHHLEAAQAEHQDDSFAVYLPVSDFYLRRPGKPYRRCHFTLLDVAIDVNFNVYGCLETIFDPRYLIGNVGPGGMSFREMLASPRRREIMDQVGQCPACCRDEVNLALEALVTTVHPNFL